jgi:hypothetical protein
VGDTGIEPVTSTVSRCRATVLTIELPASSWAVAVGLSPGFPALTSVSPSSVGTLWGQPWGQPWTAIYRADEEDSRPSAQLGRPRVETGRASRFRLRAHHEAAVYWAMITLMTRRLARPG